LPSDRWAIIHEDTDGPDIADAIPLEVAPVLPKTASQLPLMGALGAGLLLVGGAFTVLRRRATVRARG
jgi:LPXTG-motif cell wall-anchored protein